MESVVNAGEREVAGRGRELELALVMGVGVIARGEITAGQRRQGDIDIRVMRRGEGGGGKRRVAAREGMKGPGRDRTRDRRGRLLLEEDTWDGGKEEHHRRNTSSSVSHG